MAGDGKVPIVASISAGFAFMRASLTAVFPAAALVALVSAAALALSEPAVSPSPGLGLVFFAATILVQAAYWAFLLRLAIHQDASGFFGLKFGQDEARMLAVSITTGCLNALIAFLGLMAISFTIVAIAKQNGVDLSSAQNETEMAALMPNLLTGPSLAIIMGVVAFFVALLVWVNARLCLAYPASIGEKRLLIFSTFAWTQGNALPIIAVLIAIAAPLAILLAIVAGIIGAALGVQTIAATPGSGGLLPYAAFLFVMLLGEFALLIPALIGAYAYLYRGLRPPDLAARGVR